MQAHAGVVTAVEVNGPMATGEGTNFADWSSPATWALIWFLLALLLLFIL